MLPGMGGNEGAARELRRAEIDRTEAIIRSMTPSERHNTKILNGSRRARIARGSGITVTDINSLVNRFEQAAKMMKNVARGENAGHSRMGAMPPGRSREPERSAARRAREDQGQLRSGNPAKRAAENAGLPARARLPRAPASASAPREPTDRASLDMEEIQKLFGNN